MPKQLRATKGRTLGTAADPPHGPRDALRADSMLAFGEAHVLHAVSAPNAMGARTSFCKMSGAFYRPPEGLVVPRCPACYGAEATKGS